MLSKPVWISTGAGAALLAVAAVFQGCSGYPEVSNETYEYATALYSICNRHDTARLDKFDSLLTRSRQAGTISEREADWLNDIVVQARREEWAEATQAARRMLRDQVDD